MKLKGFCCLTLTLFCLYSSVYSDSTPNVLQNIIKKYAESIQNRDIGTAYTLCADEIKEKIPYTVFAENINRYARQNHELRLNIEFQQIQTWEDYAKLDILEKRTWKNKAGLEEHKRTVTYVFIKQNGEWRIMNPIPLLEIIPINWGKPSEKEKEFESTVRTFITSLLQKDEELAKKQIINNDLTLLDKSNIIDQCKKRFRLKSKYLDIDQLIMIGKPLNCNMESEIISNNTIVYIPILCTEKTANNNTFFASRAIPVKYTGANWKVTFSNNTENSSQNR